MNSIGIDESNHGRSPEIFVAAYSDREKYLTKSNGLMKKNRGNNDAARDCMSTFSFKHIIFSKEYKLVFGDELIKLIALSEFIKNYDSLDYLIFDGVFDYKNRLILEKIVFPKKIPRIIVEPKADQKYSIVHAADTIANRLYKYYGTTSNGSLNKYTDHLITPKFEDYVNLLK